MTVQSQWKLEFQHMDWRGTDILTIIPILLNIKVLFTVVKTLVTVRTIAKSKGFTGHCSQLSREKPAQKSESKKEI